MNAGLWRDGRNMDRLTVIAITTLALGLYLVVRGLVLLARAVRARYTLGAPYRRGTIADRLTGLPFRLSFLLIGLALGGIALAQSSFQDTRETVRIGRLESRRAGWGGTAITFRPDPLYVDARILEGEIAGARWAVVGTFIEWSPEVGWLGFRDGHRLHHLLGTPNTTGTTSAESGEMVILAPLPPAAKMLVACDRFLPFMRARTIASKWFPQARRRAMSLYATGEGYLAETVAEMATERKSGEDDR